MQINGTPVEGGRGSCRTDAAIDVLRNMRLGRSLALPKTGHSEERLMKLRPHEGVLRCVI